jgi:hypothetical protein
LKKVNILIGALSLLIAVALWGYVAFDVNPERERIVTDIPVEFNNERELSNRELILVEGRNATVDVRFTGRLQNLVRATKDTVRAVVDLRQVTTAGETMLEFALEGEAVSYLVPHRTRSTITVTTDRIISKYVDLTLDFAGEVAADYMRDPAIFSPASIQIRGPAKEIEAVHTAVVRYEPPDPLSRSIVDRPADYALFSENGELIESELITDNLTGPIQMTIPVVMVKSVRLTIGTIDGGGLRRENIMYDFEPESVVISGDPADLSDLWTLQVEQIDLAALSGDTTRLVPIWYPDGMRNLDHTNEARLNITINEDVSTRLVPTTNVVTKGVDLPDGYRLTLVTNLVTVTLRGPEEDLERVSPSNVRVVADFTDIETSPGRLIRPVTVFVDGFETVGAVDLGYTVVAEIVAETS